MTDVKEIKEKCPKAYNQLKGWTKKYLEAFQLSLAPSSEIEMAEITEEMAESAMEGIIHVYPRILYDFFDEQRVFIGIWRESEEFEAAIVAPAEDFSELYGGETRAAIEQDVFKSAFETLEKQLT